jgi:hypothetical protein
MMAAGRVGGTVCATVQFLVFDEERMAAEPRAVSENRARRIRIGDLDVGEYLIRPIAYVDGNAFRDRRSARIIDVPLAS